MLVVPGFRDISPQVFDNKGFTYIDPKPKHVRSIDIMDNKEGKKLDEKPKEPNQVQQRFMELVEYSKEKNVSAFEKKCGLANGYYSKIINTVADKSFKKIEDLFPGLSQAWLNYGIGEMFVLDNNSKKKVEVKQVDSGDFMEVPVLSIGAWAGYLRAGADTQYENTLQKMLVPKEYEKGHYLVVEIQGDSMDDGTRRAICEGDKLLCKEVEKNYWEGRMNFSKHLFVIVTQEDGIVCKEVVGYNYENATLVCHSWNDYYKDYEINVADVMKVFYVKKIVERRITF